MMDLRSSYSIKAMLSIYCGSNCCLDITICTWAYANLFGLLMSFDIHCIHLLQVAYQSFLQFPCAGIEADTKMCLSWHKFLYAMVIVWVEKISANCCENLAPFLILLQYIGEKGSLRTHFSSFVLYAWRGPWQHGEKHLGDITAEWSHSSLI